MRSEQGWDVPTKGERNRDALVRAGVDLLLTRGWETLTARCVAGRAGQAPSAVNYYFGGVRRLQHEVVDTVLHDLYRPVIDEVARHPSWQQGLAAAVRAHHQERAPLDDEDTSRWEPEQGSDHHDVLAELVAASLQDGVVRDQLRVALDHLRRRLVPWLERTGVPPEHAYATAVLVVATLDGLVLHTAVDDRLPAGDVADVLELSPVPTAA